MRTRRQFSSPFNWCDKRCEVCPLHTSCPVNVRAEQRRWAHTARGEDPDAPAVARADLVHELTRAIQMVQQDAQKNGIDLDAPAIETPISLSSARLERSGRAFVEAVCKTTFPDDCAVDDDDGVVMQAVRLAAKVARISSYDGPEDLVWYEDGVPNLMLIERLLSSVHASIEPMRARLAETDLTRLQSTEQELRRNLGELLRSIPVRARRTLSRMVQDGRAPSPFCVTETA
jgi:hypothetical protein